MTSHLWEYSLPEKMCYRCKLSALSNPSHGSLPALLERWLCPSTAQLPWLWSCLQVLHLPKHQGEDTAFWHSLIHQNPARSPEQQAPSIPRGSFLTSSPYKSFIRKLNISKVLARTSSEPHRFPFSHSGNNAIGESKPSRQLSPLLSMSMVWGKGSCPLLFLFLSLSTALALLNRDTSPFGVPYMSRRTGGKLSSHVQR